MHDTRLILHPGHAALTGYSNTPCDSIARHRCDCFGLLLYSYTRQIQARLLFRTGTNVPRCLPLQNQLGYGHAVCCALSGLLAFSGCDSTSSFVVCGKKTGLALISWASDRASRQGITLLGICFDVCHLLDIKQFVCHRYTCTLGLKTHMSINELRHEMFCLKVSQKISAVSDTGCIAEAHP